MNLEKSLVFGLKGRKKVQRLGDSLVWERHSQTKDQRFFEHFGPFHGRKSLVFVQKVKEAFGLSSLTDTTPESPARFLSRIALEWRVSSAFSRRLSGLRGLSCVALASLSHASPPPILVASLRGDPCRMATVISNADETACLRPRPKASRSTSAMHWPFTGAAAALHEGDSSARSFPAALHDIHLDGCRWPRS